MKSNLLWFQVWSPFLPLTSIFSLPCLFDTYIIYTGICFPIYMKTTFGAVDKPLELQVLPRTVSNLGWLDIFKGEDNLRREACRLRGLWILAGVVFESSWSTRLYKSPGRGEGAWFMVQPLFFLLSFDVLYFYYLMNKNLDFYFSWFNAVEHKYTCNNMQYEWWI
jgi:hypothetical protein